VDSRVLKGKKKNLVFNPQFLLKSINSHRVFLPDVSHACVLPHWSTVKHCAAAPVQFDDDRLLVEQVPEVIRSQGAANKPGWPSRTLLTFLAGCGQGPSFCAVLGGCLWWLSRLGLAWLSLALPPRSPLNVSSAWCRARAKFAHPCPAWGQQFCGSTTRRPSSHLALGGIGLQGAHWLLTHMTTSQLFLYPSSLSSRTQLMSSNPAHLMKHHKPK